MIRFRPAALAASALVIAAVGCAAPSGESPPIAKTPIRHLIVVVGENMSFDNLYGTYEPPPGQTVANLLSKGIVKRDGSPGPHVALAAQHMASVRERYLVTPPRTGTYKSLPRPGTTYALDQPKFEPDKRFPANLPNGPFPITRYADWTAAVGDPVHRFFQMWQQVDGGRKDLFVWVDETSGEGSQKRDDPHSGTNQGAVAMGFYNMAKGDIAYTKGLADQYAMNDNFHQSVEGGTGANHIMLGTGDAVWFSDGQGNAAVPPTSKIEDPDPQPETNNWYTEDGYGSFDAMGNPIGGGSYSQCADATQSGVAGVDSYLASQHVDPRCEKGHYYLLNNYAPGYFGDGTVNTGANNPFTVPPSTVPTIGDQLLAKGISFAYYGDQFDRYLKDPNYSDPLNNYCDICNFFQYNTSIMTNDAVRTAHLKDTIDLYSAIANGDLPAVSFVKPSGYVDGHPASSKWDLFEGFVKKIVDQVKGKPELWEGTAILVTADEGGGYYDSGYVQPVDFFGDGTRIPMIAVSPYARGGRVSHEYTDHVSILKFIERNWGLAPISKRSRDNLPNPVQRGPNKYAPVNGPAIGDLFDMFDF